MLLHFEILLLLFSIPILKITAHQWILPTISSEFVAYFRNLQCFFIEQINFSYSLSPLPKTSAQALQKTLLSILFQLSYSQL